MTDTKVIQDCVFIPVGAIESDKPEAVVVYYPQDKSDSPSKSWLFVL
jgi:hypothetical protein